MKRVIVILLAVLLLCGFCACRKSENNGTTGAATSDTAVSEEESSTQKFTEPATKKTADVTLEDFCGTWVTEQTGLQLQIIIEKNGDKLDFTSSTQQMTDGSSKTTCDYKIEKGVLYVYGADGKEVQAELSYVDDARIRLKAPGSEETLSLMRAG